MFNRQRQCDLALCICGFQHANRKSAVQGLIPTTRATRYRRASETVGSVALTPLRQSNEGRFHYRFTAASLVAPGPCSLNELSSPHVNATLQ